MEKKINCISVFDKYCNKTNTFCDGCPYINSEDCMEEAIADKCSKELLYESVDKNTI